MQKLVFLVILVMFFGQHFLSLQLSIANSDSFAALWLWLVNFQYIAELLTEINVNLSYKLQNIWHKWGEQNY